jgi:putative membrane protein
MDPKLENNLEMEMIPRDYLARQRTALANDRTLLSYIRTSLYFLVSGTALVKVEDLENVKELGYVSFAISLGMLILGFYNYFRIRRRLKKGHYTKM